MNWHFKSLLGRLLPGGATALAVLLLVRLGAWQPLEQLAYVGLFNLRGPIAWDSRVVVVGIDNASLQEFGWFPWPRQPYVQLLDQLSKADPSVIAFDLIWSDVSDDDAALEAAIANQGRVVLAEAQGLKGVILRPNARLEAVAIATGHILRYDDVDGLTRYIEPQLQDNPALGIAVVQAYNLFNDPIPLPNPNQPFWVNWYGPSQHIPHYSFSEIVKGQVPADKLRNKIVVVGVTADGIDPLQTPFDRKPSTSGVFLHATVISNILQGNPLQVPSTRWLLLILCLGGPGFSLLLSYSRPGPQLLLWAVSCLAWGGFCVIGFQAGYWPATALPIGLLTATTAVTLVSERLRMSSLLQRQIQELWQTYYPDVVKQGEGPAASLSWGGHRSNSMEQVVQLVALADQFGRSQSAQAAIARSLSAGLLASDLDGRVWFCNPVAADWLQLQVGDRLHHHLVPDWLSDAEWQADLDGLRSGTAVHPRKLHRDGHWLEMKVEPLFYRPTDTQDPQQKNSLDGVLLMLNDITEQQRVEQMKNEFVGMVSHELRTPLTSMRGSLKLLMTGRLGTLTEKGQRMLEIATDNADRLLRLVNDILDLERIESGQINLSFQTCHLDSVMTQASEVMQTMADKAGVTLAISPLAVQLWADPDCLLQVLTNLLSNAIKFSPEGGTIWLEAQQLSANDSLYQESQVPMLGTGHGPEPSAVLLQVRDQGRGIPADKLEAIFDRFQQVAVGDARQKGGTGLGLAICRTIVQQHQGKIWVESTVGQGSCFYLLLPLQPAAS